MPVIDKHTLAAGNIDKVKLAVAKHYHVPVEIFKEQKSSRKADALKLRKAVAYVAKVLFPKISFGKIGECLGGFKPNVVKHLCDSTTDLLETEKALRSDINAIIQQLVENGTTQGAALAAHLQDRFNYINLNHVKVLKLGTGQAIVFTGMPEQTIQRIKEIINQPGQILEFRHTGLSLLKKRA